MGFCRRRVSRCNFRATQNLVNAGPTPDSNLIGASLMMHSSQVAVMAGPTKATEDRLAADAWGHVFTVLAEAFRRIVVDLPANIDATSESLLRMAMHIVLVVSDDHVARQIRQFLARSCD